ncbi:serine hydrolase domain-containing protein [Streptacidiphilus jiangxiensis]|uniref:CubicO group peptidase, beta-lactamase class C family n=1 Tax=Streptacidiphilus jiangxiensis TaxID=235985 RepID=A0A1H7X8S2_STRJI|nr:serine hydrolase domain-containing protein [Streptacidiphilus jiangxiensis]SEM30226.1 CubicO group peptidase, beta-lactamase class C family [Streptacidiphilus jiangxiensis]
MTSDDVRVRRFEQSLVLEADPTGRRRSIEEVMGHYNVPGVSVAIVHGGEIVHARGYGVADAHSGQAVDPSTRFQACSISKPVSCFGMLRMVHDGALDLDRDVNDTLRSWRVPQNSDWQPVVTLRLLASHRAGLTVSGFPGYRTDDALPTLTQVLSGISPANTEGVRANIPPGLCFRYSGGGTTVLQQLLEDVQSRPFGDLMDELVFGPADMTSSLFAQPLPQPLEHTAASAHDGLGEPARGRWRVYPELAAAGLWTTPVDLAKFLIATQTSVSTDRGILPKDLAKSTLATPLAPAHPGTLSHIGVGFFLGQADGAAYLGHSGSNYGFRSLVLGERRLGSGVAVMTNSETGGNVIRTILRAVAKSFEWPGAGALDLGPTAPAATVVREPLEGTYQTEDGASLSIDDDGTALHVRVSGQPTLRFERWGESLYGSGEVAMRLVVESDERSRPLVVLRDDDTEIVYRPQP